MFGLLTCQFLSCSLVYMIISTLNQVRSSLFHILCIISTLNRVQVGGGFSTIFKAIPCIISHIIYVLENCHLSVRYI